jgi:L-rhamnose-H+ transport protein
LDEWKGVSSKTRTTITIGIAVILFSVILVGYGNYLHSQEQETLNY